MIPMRSLSLAAVAALGLALAGCSDDDAPAAAAPGGEPTALSGQVVKGVTRHALVTAYMPDGAGGFTVVGTPVLSNDQGAYSLTLPAGFQGVLKVVASPTAPPDAPTEMRCDAPSGCGTHPEGSTGDVNDDTVIDFGEWYPVGPGFSLRAVAVVSTAGVRIVNLTPVSTLAADWAETFPQGLDDRSVQAANTQVAVMFGFELADLERAIGDVTDPMFPELFTDSASLRMSLLLAAFAEVATQNSVTPEDFIDTIAALFSGQQGRLREAGDGVGPSLYDLFTTVQTVAGTLDLPQASMDELNATIGATLPLLQAGALSGHQEVSIDDMLAKLGPLGADIDELLMLTGLDDPLQFITNQSVYFDWLLQPENLQLVPLALDTVMYALMGSIYLDQMPADMGPLEIEPGVVLDPVAKTLHLTGLRQGQMVDITVGLTSFDAGIASGNFTYTMDGQTANSLALGTISGTLAIDAHDTDLAPLGNAIDQMFAGNQAAFDSLKIALYQLVMSGEATLTLDGNAQLVRLSDPTQVLGGSVSLTGHVNMANLDDDGAEVGTLVVNSANLVLPNGDHYYGREGMPVLTITVGDDGTLVLDGAATVLGLPEAVAHAEGSITNLRGLLLHVRSTLIDAFAGASAVTFGGDSLDIGALVTALLDYDFSQMSLQGQGVITIDELGHEYRASLHNFTATVYQPHSEEVALTATLDLDDPSVHFMIADEPWDLRLLGSPELRVVMLGPDGQFMEATQQDLMTFIAALPVGGLFAGL